MLVYAIPFGDLLPTALVRNAIVVGQGLMQYPHRISERAPCVYPFLFEVQDEKALTLGEIAGRATEALTLKLSASSHAHALPTRRRTRRSAS